MQTIVQGATIVLIGWVACGQAKTFYGHFTNQPTLRPFWDIRGFDCIGNPRVFYEHGKVSGCPMKVSCATTVVNLALQRDERVWLCQEHFDEITGLDALLARSQRWQNLPFPRLEPTKLAYPEHKF